MFAKKWLVVAVGAAVTAGVAVSYVVLPPHVGRVHIEIPTDIMAAREATEGPRGGENKHLGDRQRRGRCLSVETQAHIVIARGASEGPRGGDNERPRDRQRRGRGLTSDPPADLVAAKSSGRGKTRVPGGSGCDDPEDIIAHPACATANAIATGTPLRAIDPSA